MSLQLTRPATIEDLHRLLLGDLTMAPPLRGEAAVAHAGRLAALLGDPQEDARSVHVVGTAGKGSAVHATTALVTRAGLRVSSHLSPHVYDIRERFLVDGELPDWSVVLAAASELFDAAVALRDESGRPPGFFAATAALSWVLGRRVGAAVQVTEAGIGGRLDATNVVRRADKIAVVTNIGIDHAEVLGAEIREIAREKAAVVPHGGVIVVGPQSQREALDAVIRLAEQRDARLVLVDQSVTGWRAAALETARATVAELGVGRTPGEFAPPPGRGELLRVDGRPVVLDGAHNPLKLKALFGSLAEIVGAPVDRDEVTAVLALGAAKDVDGCAAVVAEGASRVVVTEFGEPSDPTVHPRSVPAMELARRLEQHGVTVVAIDSDPARAVDRALLDRRPGGAVVVTGSFLHLAAARDGLTGAASGEAQSTPR